VYDQNLNTASSIFVGIILVHIWLCLTYLFVVANEFDNSGIAFAISVPFFVSIILVTFNFSIHQLELYVQRKIRQTPLDENCLTYTIHFYKHYSGEVYE
jgi:uncharacterized membrane protein